MIQELLKIPFTELTVKSYGTMLVLGFMAAAFLMRRLSRRVGIDPLLVTNAALYTLISGVIGARIFFVLHHLDQFSGSPLEIFAIWGGGLEFLGGVVVGVGLSRATYSRQCAESGMGSWSASRACTACAVQCRPR